MPRTVATDGDKRLEHLHRFAFWLDEGVRLPGAIRRGVSRFTLGRIAWNIALDAVFGAVPVIGDAFDFAWKANLKNVALIKRHVALPDTAHKADRFFVLLLIGALFLLCAALMLVGVLLTAWLFRVIAGHP